MRFLILTQYFPPEVGAPQIRLLAIAKELRQRGHDVDVVTAMPNYPSGRVFPPYRHKRLLRETIDGISVVRTWIYPATGRNIGQRLLNYWSFTVSSLYGCWRAGRPDYIFIESPPLFLGLTAYVYSWLRRTRFILNVSDLWPESAKELGIVRSRPVLWLATRLERFLYRTAYRVSAATEGIRTAIEATGKPSAPVILLPNGVDTAVFRRMPEARPDTIAPLEIVFLYAGTHGYAQGLDVIVEAAKRLRERSDVVFLFVGDGPEKARLQQTVIDSGLRNVRFLPPQPMAAMPALFSVARASIVPLRRAPLFRSARPSKLFPSLACETCVIYSGEGDAARLIEEARCGLVVPPEAPDQLAEAVARLADEPDLARQFGRNGRALVERDYTWGRLVERWLAEVTEPVSA